MNKYIDADKLRKAIEDKGLDCSFALKMERLDILALIDELQQERPEIPSGEEVMTMCNQILIDWVKEGKTPEEREQREQAHIRFFELYDEYMQEQPEPTCKTCGFYEPRFHTAFCVKKTTESYTKREQ